MRRRNFHLPDDQNEWLDAESRKTGAAVAEIVRRLISREMDRKTRRGRRPVTRERSTKAGVR